MKYPEDIDEEAIPFLDELNDIKGIKTIGSCIGHGEGEAHISFYCDWEFDTLFNAFRLIDKEMYDCRVQLTGFEMGRPRWVFWMDDWLQITTLIRHLKCAVCEHEWIDPTNEVVSGGVLCLKCGRIM